MDFTEYDTRLAGYAVVVDDERRMLLALFNELAVPTWTLPGGGVELDETVHDAVVREVREETGYDVALDRILAVDTNVIPPEERLRPTQRPLKSLRVLYEARVIGGELRHEVGGTTDEARWFPLGEVPTLPRVAHVDLALELVTRTSSTDDMPFP